ncbi:hypothetical protein FRB99_008799 [Tulasnella sp. 403]|nr:hypothetical protein FRB99_008799 [Tulasnella sp. 403]
MVRAIFQITLPKKYERRFEDALDAADRAGGSTTRATFFGGQCICDVGVPQPGGAYTTELCNWPSCSICIVIKKGFDTLEFGVQSHEGIYGPGIYTHQNPANAHRFTVGKSTSPFRAMIVCSVIKLDEHAKSKKVPASFIDEIGRVYCPAKDFIIPRQLVIYQVTEPGTGTAD